MVNETNWQEVRNQFEKEIVDKLKGLPGHGEVSKNLFEFRSMISHEMPETAPKELFQKLIKILLLGKKVDLESVKKKYLSSELREEEQLVKRHSVKFSELQKSAANWVQSNLSEEELQMQWKNHETWLPRRHTIYKNPDLPFQKIARDTLARFCLIKEVSSKLSVGIVGTQSR